MWNPSITTWNGNAINDGSTFAAYFEGDVFYRQASGGVDEHERSNNPPVMANKQPKAKNLRIVIISKSSVTDFSDAYNTLNGYFDTFDDTERLLVVTDASSNQWYVYATPVETPRVRPDGFVVDLRVMDPIWRRVTTDTDTWNITATGQTNDVTISGNRPVKPIIRITATNAKSGGYAYKAVRVWRNPSTTDANPHPLDITNAAWDMAALTTAKCQADGDDVAVFGVDGRAKLSRWFGNIDTATTSVWINNYFAASYALTLGVAIAASGALTTVTTQRTNANLLALQKLAKLVPFHFGIGSEVFMCTSVDPMEYEFNFTGSDMRSQVSSSKAAHSVGDAIYAPVVPFWLAYGNASATTPVQDETQKPLIDLDNSTNVSWRWLLFREDANLRTAGWSPLVEAGRASKTYGGSHTAAADPNTEMGMSGYPFEIYGTPRADSYRLRWTFWHPAGCTGITCAGDKYRYSTDFATVAGLWRGNSSILGMVSVFNESTPASAQSWTAWTQTGLTFTASKYLQFRFEGSVRGLASNAHHFEVQTISAVTFDSAGVAQLFFSGTEQSAYEFGEAATGKKARLTNLETGDYFEIGALVDLNYGIEIDCENETVTYLKDNSRIDAALDYPARNYIMNIDPRLGANTFQWDDDGTTAVTITFTTANRNT